MKCSTAKPGSSPDYRRHPAARSWPATSFPPRGPTDKSTVLESEAGLGQRCANADDALAIRIWFVSLVCWPARVRLGG